MSDTFLGGNHSAITYRMIIVAMNIITKASRRFIKKFSRSIWSSSGIGRDSGGLHSHPHGPALVDPIKPAWHFHAFSTTNQKLSQQYRRDLAGFALDWMVVERAHPSFPAVVFGLIPNRSGRLGMLVV